MKVVFDVYDLLQSFCFLQTDLPPLFLWHFLTSRQLFACLFKSALSVFTDCVRFLLVTEFDVCAAKTLVANIPTNNTTYLVLLIAFIINAPM